MKHILLIILIFYIILSADNKNIYNGAKEYKNLNSKITKDLLSGIIWQKSFSSRLNYEDAKKYCQNLTISDIDDWVMPPVHYLYFLYDKNKKKHIDTKYFRAQSKVFWAFETHAMSKIHAWSVDFSNSATDYENKKNRYYVRCVSRSSIPKELNEQQRFIRKNKIVIDTLTGFYWQDDNSAYTNNLSQTDAKEYCQGLSLGGYNDWRLPSIDEFMSINNFKRFSPSSYYIFKNVQNSWYWSSTKLKKRKTHGWIFQYNEGINNWDRKKMTWFVRCLRLKK